MSEDAYPAISIKPNDWVRFYRNGQLVIGKVEYVSEDSILTWRLWLHTDQGKIEANSVLEIRRWERRELP